MTKNVFRSKSSKKIEDKKKKEADYLNLLLFQHRDLFTTHTPVPPQRSVSPQIPMYVSNIVMWIGEDPDGLFTHGESFGFTCIRLNDRDLSTLTNVKCLVVSHIDLDKKSVSVINFAREYGISTVWLHKFLPPPFQFWNFDLRFYTSDINEFWGGICRIVE